MAGLGYNLFVAGQVLTAAQVNGYLMQQSNMVFADGTARDTALSAVKSEGNEAFLLATNVKTYFTGSGTTWSTFGPVHGALNTGPTLTVTQLGSVTFTVTSNQTFRVGRMIYLNALLAVTGAGTGGNDVVIGGHLASAGGIDIVGVASIVDTSDSSKRYYGLAVAPTTTTIKIVAATGTVGFLGSTGFAALASGDFISLDLWYPTTADA